ncbi:MAG: sigma-70 family RNA polymerase sigma factor [Bacteroidota bacterium]
MDTQITSDYKEEFDRVYREHFSRLYTFAITLTKCEEFSKDVISDVFVNLWNSKIDFSKIRDIESYLFITVKNYTIQALSKRAHRIKGINIEMVLKETDMADPEHVLIEKELLVGLENIIQSLPSQCQLVFRLAREKNMTYQQISDELGIATSTVKSHMIKAIATIRIFIVEKYSESTVPFVAKAWGF